MSQTIYPFTITANYTKNNTVVEDGKGKLSLVNNAGQNFAQNFSSSAGFTFKTIRLTQILAVEI